jgi:hypothetical protein
MKLTQLTLKKVYGKKLTIKDTSGGYDSTDNQAEVVMTFEGDNIDVDKAKEEVRKHAIDLLDDDASFVKDRELGKKE